MSRPNWNNPWGDEDERDFDGPDVIDDDPFAHWRDGPYDVLVVEKVTGVFGKGEWRIDRLTCAEDETQPTATIVGRADSLNDAERLAERIGRLLGVTVERGYSTPSPYAPEEEETCPHGDDPETCPF